MTQGKTPGFSTHPELGTQRSTHQHSKKAASLLRVLSSRTDIAKHLILVGVRSWRVGLLLRCV